MFGEILSGTAGLINAGTNIYTAITNNKNQKKANDINQQTLDWQKEQWNQTKEREDNAVQRRAKDLEAAGLSKTLAAGSASDSKSAPSLPQITAPQYSNPFSSAIDGVSQALGLLQQKQDYSRTVAETELAQQQMAKSRAEEIRLLADTDFIASRTRNTELDNAFREMNNGIFSQRWQIEQGQFDLARSRLGLDVSRFAFDKEKWADVERDNILQRLEMDSIKSQAQTDLLNRQTIKSMYDADVVANDLEKAKSAGTTVKESSPVGKVMKDINDIVEKILPSSVPSNRSGTSKALENKRRIQDEKRVKRREYHQRHKSKIDDSFLQGKDHDL